MKKLLIILFIIISVSIFYFTNKQSEQSIPTYPNDWFYMQRSFPNSEINHKAYIEGLKKTKQQLKQNQLLKTNSVWEFAGPMNTGGRISDVEMHPSDLQQIYIGAASGGVFKSNDLGVSWEPIFDSALSLSIGDIAISPSDKDIIYIDIKEYCYNNDTYD